MISVIMLPNIVGRALCLGVIVGITKFYGFLVLFIVFASQLILCCLESIVSKTKITSIILLGILTSFTSPCLVMIEQSRHFLVNGMSGSIIYIIVIWSIYLFMSANGNIFPNSPLSLECYNNITTDSIMRCPVNLDTKIDECLDGFFHIEDEPLFTICPERNWFLLWIASIVISVLMILSLASISILHYLIDTEKRMMFFKKIGINICPERDTFIKPFIVDIMEGKRKFDEIDKEAIDKHEMPVLDLMIKMKRLHMTKVCSFFHHAVM